MEEWVYARYRWVIASEGPYHEMALGRFGLASHPRSGRSEAHLMGMGRIVRLRRLSRLSTQSKVGYSLFRE